MRIRLLTYLLSGIFFCSANTFSAQLNVTTFGIQLKPMIPSKYFGTGTENAELEDLKVNFEPNPGLNFGMVVRKGISRNWSIESGICMVQRNFTLHYNHPQLLQEKQLRFRYIGYEIPIQAMVFVKLTDEIFMNASAGLSLDLYPSNVESSAFEYRDTLRFDFYQKTYKNGWIQPALLANYGFEWRTPSKGYFYLGASYHRPFQRIGTTRVEFKLDDDPTTLLVRLGGNYLTADFRYFFHEKPERRKAKKSDV
jgi:hypothetical protein